MSSFLRGIFTGPEHHSSRHTLYIRLEEKCHPKYCYSLWVARTVADTESTHVTFLGTKLVTFPVFLQRPFRTACNIKRRCYTERVGGSLNGLTPPWTAALFGATSHFPNGDLYVVFWFRFVYQGHGKHKRSLVLDLALRGDDKFSRIVCRIGAEAPEIDFFFVGGQVIQLKLDGVPLWVIDLRYLDLNELAGRIQVIRRRYFLGQAWSA